MPWHRDYDRPAPRECTPAGCRRRREHVIDAHASDISRLLLTMRDAPVDEVADAAYRALQRTPTTSLLTRSAVTVEKATGSSERRCVITSPQIPLGYRIIAAADIRSSTP